MSMTDGLFRRRMVDVNGDGTDELVAHLDGGIEEAQGFGLFVYLWRTDYTFGWYENLDGKGLLSQEEYIDDS